MSIAIIINPVAGARGRGGTIGHRVDLARHVADASGEPADIHVTEQPGHARLLAQTACENGARLVVAWGGDGTINEVATALVDREVPMAIVRGGSGNGLARELGVSADPRQALRAALEATPRLIDVGEIAGRLFVNAAGIGFDADVAAHFNAPANRQRAFRGYAMLTARRLMRYSARQYVITTADSSFTVRALLVVLANGTQFGNGVRIAPSARLNDGELDLVVVQAPSRLTTLWNMRHVLFQSIERATIWSSRRTRQATIESDQPMRFHVDGEHVEGGTRLEARVRPAALRICV